MKEIIKALMNLGSETVTVHYRNGKIVTGRRQLVDVFSNTVIIKDPAHGTFHKISFEDIDLIILAGNGKEPRTLKNN